MLNWFRAYLIYKNMIHMNEMTLRIGTRKSRLALWQTNFIAEELRKFNPELRVEIVEMDTTGDKIRDKPLPEIGGKGLFTLELENALHEGSVDIAVHSLKDLPSALPEGLAWIGSPRRADPKDAFISSRYKNLDEVPAGETIATGSVRRRAQILSQYPTLEFVDLRGNIDTRLRKLEEGGWAGIIMAAAAIERLERDDLPFSLMDTTRFVPAVSQGAIGIEAKEGREDLQVLFEKVFDSQTIEACTAERKFMNMLEGGCSVSLGAFAQKDDKGWIFRGWISNQRGTEVLSDEVRTQDVLNSAEEMANAFIERGARRILGRS